MGKINNPAQATEVPVNQPYPAGQQYMPPVHQPYPPGPQFMPSVNQPYSAGPQLTQPGAWSSGLCACCDDIHSCCLTSWCPCIAIGRIAEIVDKGSSSCCGAGCIYALLSLFACQRMYSRKYRTKIREQYGIPGSKCGDCFTNYFCECCSITQMYRELTIRHYDVSIGWKGNLKKMQSEPQGVNMAPVVPDRMYG